MFTTDGKRTINEQDWEVFLCDFCWLLCNYSFNDIVCEAVEEHKQRNKIKHSIYVILGIDELGLHPNVDSALNIIKKVHLKEEDQIIPIFTALTPQTFKLEFQKKQTLNSRKPLTWLNLSTMPKEERQNLALKQKPGLQKVALLAYNFVGGVYRRIEEINKKLEKMKTEEKSIGKLFLEAISLSFLYNCRNFWKCFAVAMLRLQTTLGEEIIPNITTCSLMIHGILSSEKYIHPEEFGKENWSDKIIDSCLVQTLYLYTYSLKVLNYSQNIKEKPLKDDEEPTEKNEEPTEKDICIADLFKCMVKTSAHVNNDKKFEECMDYFLIVQLTLRSFLIDSTQKETSYPSIPTLTSLSSVRSVPFSKLFHDCIQIGKGCDEEILHYNVLLCDKNGKPFQFEVDLDKKHPHFTNASELESPLIQYERLFADRFNIVEEEYKKEEDKKKLFERQFKMNVCFGSSHPEEPAIDALLALFVLIGGVMKVLYLMIQYKSREIATKTVEKKAKGEIQEWLENAVDQQKKISKAIKGKICPITRTVFPGQFSFLLFFFFYKILLQS